MSELLNSTSQNINYLSHTNSSEIQFSSSSSRGDSLADLIKNCVLVIDDKEPNETEQESC